MTLIFFFCGFSTPPNFLQLVKSVALTIHCVKVNLQVESGIVCNFKEQVQFVSKVYQLVVLIREGQSSSLVGPESRGLSCDTVTLAT